MAFKTLSSIGPSHICAPVASKSCGSPGDTRLILASQPLLTGSLLLAMRSPPFFPCQPLNFSLAGTCSGRPALSAPHGTQPPRGGCVLASCPLPSQCPPWAQSFAGAPSMLLHLGWGWWGWLGVWRGLPLWSPPNCLAQGLA